MQFILSNPLLIGLVILAVITLILLWMVISMRMKLKSFLVAVDAQNIADSLSSVSSDLKELQTFRTELENYLTEVERRVRNSIQSVHTVRFNPFKGVGAGGNQSFATAILNQHGDGVIISSLYSRDHVSIFSKPVKKMSAEHELSEEEKEALDQAKEKLK